MMTYKGSTDFGATFVVNPRAATRELVRHMTIYARDGVDNGYKFTLVFHPCPPECCRTLHYLRLVEVSCVYLRVKPTG